MPPIHGSTGNDPRGDAARLLDRGLAELASGEVGPRARDALLQLATLLEQWAARINLSGHGSAEAIVRHLILDSLVLGEMLPPFQSLADLGSGAGIPGLPLAICHPTRRFTLIESRERRHHFQQAARRALGLGNVRLRHGRAERLPATPHDGAVARAAASPGTVLDWMLRWVRPGGWIAIPCGASASAPELPATDPQGRYEDAQVVRHPGILSGPERRIWVARCCAPPSG